MASGDPDKAICDFSRAIELRPDYPRAYSNRANACLRKGRNGLAVADFERIGRNPMRLIVGFGMAAAQIFLLAAVLAYRLYRRKHENPQAPDRLSRSPRSILNFKHQSAGLDAQAFDPPEHRRSISFAHCLANQVLSFQSTQPGFRQAQPEDRDIF